MELETRIFLVRHGETEWNKHHRMQGNKDSPLTPNGVKQAREVRKSLEQSAIDCAFVSPLKRAIDTAVIILKESSIDFVIRDNLREINLGPWEGKTREETWQSHPDEHIAFRQRPDLFNLPGAETFGSLQIRIVKELETIFADEKGKNILVVSHWMAIKVALAHYTSTPLSHLSEITNPANGGFFCLSKRGGEVSIQ